MTRKQWLLETISINAATPKFPNASMLIYACDYVYLKRIGMGKVTAQRLCPIGDVYATCTINGKWTQVHRLLMPTAALVDHKNHNTLDNTRKNLRSCTHSQNSMNRIKTKANTSGIVGVSWHKGKKKWVAHIKIDGVMIQLICCKNKMIAIRKRKQAERYYFGEYRLGSN